MTLGQMNHFKFGNWVARLRNFKIIILIELQNRYILENKLQDGEVGFWYVRKQVTFQLSITSPRQSCTHLSSQ